MDVDVDGFNAWIALVSAVAAGAAWLWRNAIANVWNSLWKIVGGLLHMVDTFPALVSDMSFVKHEVQYNGGSTNKDMTRRLVHTVEYLLGEAEISTFTSDDKGLIVSVSDRAVERLQCQRQDLLGNGWKSFLEHEKAEKFIDEWESIVRDGRAAHIDGVKVVTPNGVAHVDVELTALRGNNGQFTGHIGYVRKSLVPWP